MSRVNWVVAGIGDIARRRVLPAIVAEGRSTLYGLVTRDESKARAYPGAKAWSSIDQALTDHAVDAVYIALPVSMHADCAIAALRAGKHVLCEKPMAMNDDQGRRMVAQALASERMLGVAYYRRLYPKLIRARQLLAAGAIGRPLMAEANCHSRLPSPERGWLLDPAMAGGGPLYDIASHRIDAMHFLFGKAEEVCGMRSNAVYPLAVEDSATVLMKFQGGVHGVVDVRWNSEIARDQFRVIGSEGELGLDPLNGPELRVNGRVEMLAPHANLHFPLVENFVDALVSKAPASLTCPGEQGRWVDWVIEQVVCTEREPSS
jgi:predicted dehydrogenase